MDEKGYIEFPHTSSFNAHLDQLNSYDHFRDGRKRITPDNITMERVKNLIKDKLCDKVVELKWFHEFKQLYCYMYINKTHQTYYESSESNKKLLIVDFYTDDWIFCSLVDKNEGRSMEVHYVCDDIQGFEKFLNGEKEKLLTKIPLGRW